MANLKLLFYDTESENEIQLYANTENEIFIAINKELTNVYDINTAYISLDIDTAIKLSKELRRQIAIAKFNKEK